MGRNIELWTLLCVQYNEFKHVHKHIITTQEPSIAQGNHSYSRRLPARGRKLRI